MSYDELHNSIMLALCRCEMGEGWDHCRFGWCHHADGVLAVVRVHDKDAEIGRLVRRKLVSGNDVPVERCTIRAEEVAAIDATKEPPK